TMIIGRSALTTGTATGSGILTFTDGSIDVNTIEAGYQNGTNSPAVGVINVNGPTASLTVNTSIRLARINGGSAQATLNINFGSATLSNVVAGGGTSTINVNAGTITLLGTIGAPGAGISSLNLTNSVWHLNLAVPATNIVANSLIASGVNHIIIDSVSNIAGLQSYPLISYGTFNGSFSNNFALDSTDRKSVV